MVGVNQDSLYSRPVLGIKPAKIKFDTGLQVNPLAALGPPNFVVGKHKPVIILAILDRYYGEIIPPDRCIHADK